MPQRSGDAFASWRRLPRHTRRIELGLCAVAGIAAVLGCVLVQSGSRTDILGVALFFGALLLVAPSAAFNRALSKPDGVGAVLRNLVGYDRGDPLIQGLRDMAAPGLAVWLLPLVVLPFDLLTIPYGNAVDDLGDAAENAWMLSIFSWVVPLVGLLIWLLVLLPVLALARAVLRLLTGAARSEAPDLRLQNRLALGSAGLLLSVVTFATTLVLGAPDLKEPTRHGAQGQQFLALVGLNPGIVEHPVLLWVARASVLVIIVSTIVLARVTRASRRTVREIESPGR